MIFAEICDDKNLHHAQIQKCNKYIFIDHLINMDTSRRLAFASAENSRNTNAKALNTLCHYKTSLEQISK